MGLLINGEYVADRLFFEELERLRAAEPDAAAEVQQHQARERVVHRVVLRQMAVQAGMTVPDADVEAERRRRWGSSDNSVSGVGILEGIRNDLLVQRMSAHLARHVPRPSRTEVEMFYRANAAMFRRPERVQVSHIVRNVESAEQEQPAQEAMAAAMAELERGRAFAKVAEAYSDCKGTGGSIGWIARGDMVEAFDEVVFSLPVGARSSLFRTVFGWHIAMVTGRKAAGLEPLEAVRGELARGLFEGRRESTVLAAVSEVVRRVPIVPAEQDDRGPVLGEKVPR